jgi:hypothetical protein
MIVSCAGLMTHVKGEWKTFRKGTKEGSVKERKERSGKSRTGNPYFYYPLQNIIGVNKSRQLKLAGHAARMGEKANA